MEFLKKSALAFFSSGKAFKPVLVFLLFAPLFYHGPRFGTPYVKGGDEPHYLIMINSLLNDGDLDLRNNYESARKGSLQAGRKFAGMALEPHVVWMVGGKRVLWSQVYEDAGQWERGADRFYVPVPKPAAGTNVEGLPAYSSHPGGIALLLAPFLWAFRGTPATEPLALLCSNIAVILAAFFFRGILKRYTADPFSLNLATFMAFLGTPLWAYGRTLFMEPYLSFFAMAAFYLILEKESGLLAGIALGLGALLKPNFLILFLPLAVFCARNKNFRTILWMAAGPAVSTAAILYSNALMYGSPFAPPQPFRFGNVFEGMGGLLFSWNHGIISLAPIALLALALWKRFFRERKAEAALIAAGFAVYFLMMAFFDCWWGGWCYGPRLVVPVLPLLMVPVFYLPEAFRAWSKPARLFALTLCLLSLAFNLLGALDGYWDSHPWTLLKGNLS